MKKTLFLFGLLFLAGAVRADFSLDKWPYYKDVVGVKSGLTLIPLDNEIFANSLRGLSDLRVIDSSNQEVSDMPF